MKEDRESWKNFLIELKSRGLKGVRELLGTTEFQIDPFSNSLFLFCGHKCNRINALFCEGDGFVLLYRRLENGTF